MNIKVMFPGVKKSLPGTKKRRPGESRDPFDAKKNWIPAFAGMTF